MTSINIVKPIESKKNTINYQKYGNCDSIIIKIRNSSAYWKMLSEIEKVARQEIGYNNAEFNNFKFSDNSRITNFSEKCHDEFKIVVRELKVNYVNEIQRIKKGKVDRLNRLRLNSRTIELASIKSFLETFDMCETDFKALEIIILGNPNDFVASIENMSDSDFFSFTLKLDNFPKDSQILQMKEALKECERKTRRKKKVIRKIKKTKANIQGLNLGVKQ